MDIRKYKGWPISKIAKDFNINTETLRCRLKSGMSFQEACTKPVRKRKIPSSVTVQGVVYSSLPKACRKYKIRADTVRYRLDRGWTIEEALEIVPRKSSTKRNGKIYKITNTQNNRVYIGLTTRTLEKRFYCHKLDAKNGSNTKFHTALRKIGYNKFKIKLLKEESDIHKLAKLEVKYIKKYNSINKGYNDHAGGNGLGDRVGKSIDYDDVTFVSYKALADYLSIYSRTLEYRIKNKLPLAGKSKQQPVFYEGKEFKSKSALARHLGITISALLRREKAGYSLNKPLTDTSIKVKYRGKIYESAGVLGRIIGVHPQSILDRLKNNFCLNGPKKFTGKPGYYRGKIVI